MFSNKAWCYPLKQKTKEETKKALITLFDELDGQIQNFFVDQGQEFELPDVYEKYHINKYSVKSPLKSCHIENFNRILENRIYRVLTANCTLKWLIYLSDIVDSYNSTPTRRLYGLSPNQAVLSPHTEFLQQKFLEEHEAMKAKYKDRRIDIKEGMLVHVVKPKTKFQRGYKPMFYEQPRKVTKILETYPPTFRIAGHNRSFYRAELAPTTAVTIEKPKSFYILKERKVGGRQLRSKTVSGQIKQYLIKSYTDIGFEEWVDEKEVRRLYANNVLHNFGQWFK